MPHSGGPSPSAASHGTASPPPRFSIVTPSFNQSAWLQLCVASVADQDVAKEHIVQDAGSTDGTLDWLAADQRVIAMVEKDRGMYDAINRGLRKARGPLLAYLNCDEQYLPGALAMVQAHFDRHPETDVLFADAVVVDTDGQYLWHRKVQVPGRWHTALFPLSTLTCATFFRRRVVEELGVWFDPEWRYCGDSVWVRALLRAGVRMAALGRFTSVFTHTGENLSLRPEVGAEAARYYAEAPAWSRGCRPVVLAHHRMRRWLAGGYRQAPFQFSLFTPSQPTRRTERTVEQPTSRWHW